MYVEVAQRRHNLLDFWSEKLCTLATSAFRPGGPFSAPARLGPTQRLGPIPTRNQPEKNLRAILYASGMTCNLDSLTHRMMSAPRTNASFPQTALSSSHSSMPSIPLRL